MRIRTMLGLTDRFNPFWLVCLTVIFAFMTTSTSGGTLVAHAQTGRTEGKQPIIQVNLTKTQGGIDPNAFGLTLSPHGNDTSELMTLFRTITGTQQLRTLGFRSLSYGMDHDNWQAPYNTYTALPEPFPLVMKTDEFLQLSKTMNADPMIAVNITIRCRPGVPPTDQSKITCNFADPKQDAADWLTYIKSLGIKSVKYVQLGTEPYAGCPYWTEKNQNNLGCTTGTYGSHRVALPQEVYAQHVSSWVKALKQVDPNIQVGLHLQPNTTKVCDTACTMDWDQYLLKNVGSQVDFVITHNYYLIHDPATTIAQAQQFSFYQEQLDMRVRKNEVGATPAVIRQELLKWLPNKKQALKMPIFIGEYNAGLVRADGAGTDPNAIAAEQVTGRMSLYTGISIAELTLDMLSPVPLNKDMVPGAQRALFLDLSSLPAMLAHYLPLNAALPTMVYSPAWQLIAAIQNVQGKTWVGSSIQNNPQLSFGKNKHNALSIYSAKQGKQLWIAIFNHDNTQAYTTNLTLVGGKPKSGTITRVGDTAASFLTQNTPQNPSAIAPVTSSLLKKNLKNNLIKQVKFPPHSLTVLQVTLK